jgi:hypothetical protein
MMARDGDGLRIRWVLHRQQHSITGTADERNCRSGSSTWVFLLSYQVIIKIIRKVDLDVQLLEVYVIKCCFY